MLLKSMSGSVDSIFVGLDFDFELVIKELFLLGRSKPFFVIIAFFC